MRLKRYAMPKFWRIGKKRKFWVVRPLPGPHPQERSIPLQVVLRDMLKYAETGKEAKRILTEKKVMVDGKVRTEPAYAVGFQDIISFPDLKKNFRVGIGTLGLVLEEIKESEADRKLCRIEAKKNLRGGLTHLRLHDGRNITLKDGKPYKRFDSLLISVPGQKILKHYKFGEGAPAFVIAGNNMGISGKLKEIRRRDNMLKKSTATIQTREGEVQTLLEYIMVGEVSGTGHPQPKVSK